MDALDRLLTERDLERLIFEYCRRIDFGESGRIADLFTEDGEWHGLDLVLAGQDAIRAWFLERQGLTRRVSRHLVTNVEINLTSATEAEGTCYLINYRRDRSDDSDALPIRGDIPKYVGECRDRYRLTDDGWKFARRQVDVAFIRRNSGCDS